MRSQIVIGDAITRVLSCNGLVTAIVFGVTSPNSSKSGTMMSIFRNITFSSVYRWCNIAVIFAAAATFDDLVSAQNRDDQAARLVKQRVEGIGLGVAGLA